MNKPVPFEQEDPELGELVKDLVDHNSDLPKHERTYLYTNPYGDVSTTIPTVVRDFPKIGRNDPCPCGSGKKHKKCCL